MTLTPDDAGELLRARGMRSTPARRVILSVFRDGRTDSADEVYCPDRLGANVCLPGVMAGRTGGAFCGPTPFVSISSAAVDGPSHLYLEASARRSIAALVSRNIHRRTDGFDGSRNN